MGFWEEITGQAGAESARNAAAGTFRNQKYAADEMRQAGGQYQGTLQELMRSYDPYVQGGGKAQNQVYSLMGLNGQQQQGDAFGQFRTDPGYQFQMDQGLQAVDRGAAARSGVQNGATIRGEQRFGANLADQSYGNYLQRLMGLGTQGLGATQAQVLTGTQGAQGNLQGSLLGAQGDMGAAGTIGQGDIAAANAQAAGSQNLLNTGVKVGGMLLGAATGNPFMMMGGSPFGSSFSGAGNKA